MTTLETVETEVLGQNSNQDLTLAESLYKRCYEQENGRYIGLGALSGAVAYRDLLRQHQKLADLAEKVNKLFSEQILRENIWVHIYDQAQKIEKTIEEALPDLRDEVTEVDFRNSSADCVSQKFFDLFPKLVDIKVWNNGRLQESMQRIAPEGVMIWM